jgi:hypothetical protein
VKAHYEAICWLLEREGKRSAPLGTPESKQRYTTKILRPRYGLSKGKRRRGVTDTGHNTSEGAPVGRVARPTTDYSRIRYDTISSCSSITRSETKNSCSVPRSANKRTGDSTKILTRERDHRIHYYSDICKNLVAHNLPLSDRLQYARPTSLLPHV